MKRWVLLLTAWAVVSCGPRVDTISSAPYAPPLAPGTVYIAYDDPERPQDERDLRAKLAAALATVFSAGSVFTSVVERPLRADYIFRLERVDLVTSYAPQRWLSDGDGVRQTLDVLVALDRTHRRARPPLPVVTFRVQSAATTPNLNAPSETLSDNRAAALEAALIAAGDEIMEFLENGD